jgi:hypothetical protein
MQFIPLQDNAGGILAALNLRAFKTKTAIESQNNENKEADGYGNG